MIASVMTPPYGGMIHCWASGRFVSSGGWNILDLTNRDKRAKRTKRLVWSFFSRRGERYAVRGGK